MPSSSESRKHHRGEGEGNERRERRRIDPRIWNTGFMSYNFPRSEPLENENNNARNAITKSKVKMQDQGLRIANGNDTCNSKLPIFVGKVEDDKNDVGVDKQNLLSQIIKKEKVLPKKYSSPIEVSPAELNPDARVTINTTGGMKMKRIAIDSKQSSSVNLGKSTSSSHVKNSGGKNVKPDEDFAVKNGAVVATSTVIVNNRKLKRKSIDASVAYTATAMEAQAQIQKSASTVAVSQKKRKVPEKQHATYKSTTKTDAVAVATAIGEGKAKVEEEREEQNVSKTLLAAGNGSSEVSKQLDPSTSVSENTEAIASGGGTQSNQSSKIPTYYKSSFWNYINATEESTCHHAERQRPHDAAAVQQFISKQKEIRRAKQLAELRSRQEQLEKKKRTLLELNEKCKDIARQTSAKPHPPQPHGVVESRNISQGKEVKKGRYTLVNVGERQSSRTIFRKQFTQGRRFPSSSHIPPPPPVPSSHSSRTSMLEEFQEKVSKDCLDYLNQSKSKSLLSSITKIPKAFVDKEVGTTDSLLGDLRSRSDSLSSTSTVIAVRNKIRDFNDAAAKIQAAYKGYKTRKVLKEASILPKQLVELKRGLGDISSAFYLPIRPAEKPYDLFPKKNHEKLEQISYIPPKRVDNDNEAGMTASSQDKKKQLLSLLDDHPRTPVKVSSRRSFNEPYPRDAIRRFEELHAQANTSRRNSLSEVRTCILLDTSATKLSGSGVSTPSADARKSKRRAFSAPRPQIAVPAPSITAVLFEKLRLLEIEKQREARLNDIPSVVSEPMSEKELSVSSISRCSPRQDSVAASADVTITDEYFGPSISDRKRTRASTPIKQKGERRRKSRSRSRSTTRSSEASENSTTVDTDADLFVDFHHNRQKSGQVLPHQVDTKSSKSQTEFTPPSQPTEPEVVVPAMKLQYRAERERLHILEKALKTATQIDRKHRPGEKVPSKSEIEEIAKKVAEDRVKLTMAEVERDKLAALIRQHENSGNEGIISNLHLEMMKCQQEAAKATAEITRWVTEMGKAMLDDQNRRVRTVDDATHIAAIVYAAVDEAKRIVEEGKKHRKQKREKDLSSDSQEINHRKKAEGESIGLQMPSVSEAAPVYDKRIQSLEQTLGKEHSVDGEEEKEAITSETATETNNDTSGQNIQLLSHISSPISSFVQEPQSSHYEEKPSSIEFPSDEHHEFLSQNEEKLQSSPVSVPVEADLMSPDVESISFAESFNDDHDVLQSRSHVQEQATDKADVSESYHESFLQGDSEMGEFRGSQEQFNISEAVGSERQELSEHEDTEAKPLSGESDKESEAEISHTSQKIQSPVSQENAIIERGLDLETNVAKDDAATSIESPHRENQAFAPSIAKDITIHWDQKEDVQEKPKGDDDEVQGIPENVVASDPESVSLALSYRSDVDVSEVNTETKDHGSAHIETEQSEKYSESFLSEEEKDSELEALANYSAKSDSQSEQEVEESQSVIGQEAEAEVVAVVNEDEEERAIADTKEDDILEQEKNETEEKNDLVEVEGEELALGDKAELLELVQQQEKVENEIKELEAQITSPIEDYLAALEEQGSTITTPTSPRFTYPTYFDEFLQEIHSSEFTPEVEKVHQMIVDEVERVWGVWDSTGLLPVDFNSSVSTPGEFMGNSESKEQEGEQEEGENVFLEAIQNYKSYVHQQELTSTRDLIRESIKEVLRIKELKTPGGFVDTCRRGSYAVEAMQYKIPKTEEGLIFSVRSVVTKFLSEDGESDLFPQKWSCKPRDIAENILVGEMIGEERLGKWTEVWPEALFLQDEIGEHIIKESISVALKNFEIAYK